jgi:hypothetical protein
MNSTIDLLGYIFIAVIVFAFIYIYFKKSDFQLKCIISDVNGNTFCVRERTREKEAVDLLAKIAEKTKQFVEYLKNKFPEKENIKRLVNGFNPDTIKETLPNSKHTAFTENKKNMYFCLNVKKDSVESELIDEHTLTFVALHEMAHIATKSIGHKSEFWENFRFLLEEAKMAGIHEPVDYKQEPAEYCSTKIKDNPYYELKSGKSGKSGKPTVSPDAPSLTPGILDF